MKQFKTWMWKWLGLKSEFGILRIDLVGVKQGLFHAENRDGEFCQKLRDLEQRVAALESKPKRRIKAL